MTSGLVGLIDTTRTESFTRRAFVPTAYVALAVLLLWSRFAAFNDSLWHDEIYTVEHFILPGPAASFVHYNPNDHILFSVLGWLTVRLPGLGDSFYRLWSVVPFIAAVVFVTSWLHRRAGASEALLFALLATASTELLGLSTEARGYGLAFLAMAVMTVSAQEAINEGTSRWLTLFAAAGLVGCWTLPTFAIPLAGSAGVLLLRSSLRRRLLIRLGIASIGIAGWYAVPSSALLASRGQAFGRQLPWHAPLTGPANALAAAFIPSVDVAAFLPALIVLPVLVVGLEAARRRGTGLAEVTVAPVLATFGVLTLGGFFVEERFVSFLLVPIFIIAALGLKALLRPRASWNWVISASYAAVLLGASVLVFWTSFAQHARLPQEANREAGNAVASAFASSRRPVILNTAHPRDVLYYVHRPVSILAATTKTLERDICSPRMRTTGLIFVQQPWGVDTVDTSCLARAGATVHVYRQWDRGLKIAVWELPRGR